ncbi:MAG: hypothetical protein HUJ86_08205 [Synergistes sp.]|nr:hypothetical protein [Synergistes sp.]
MFFDIFRKKPEKLKRIPCDLVEYIMVETEVIQDANDKYMLASYTKGKLQTVNWYIELLESKSEKYIVPHSLRELETTRDQLNACLKAIMAVKIRKPGERRDCINWPEGLDD